MDKNSAIHGVLYIVATPIGNRDDMTPRAIKTLQSVDAILAEDTRHSGQLLRNIGIQKPLISLHAHNEHEKSLTIIHSLLAGKSYALISDAGTPLISDPGFLLVRAAHEQGIRVVPIPGACALIAALSASGIACERFYFSGFLPAKQAARLEKLRTFIHQDYTILVYESTHRIKACLHDVLTVFGASYSMVLAKELTKIHEQLLNAPVADIIAWLEVSQHDKGEFVLIFPASSKNISETRLHDQHLLRVLLNELPLKQAVKIAAALSTTSKNSLYDEAISLCKNAKK